MKTKTKQIFKTAITIPILLMMMLLSFSVHSQTHVYNETTNSGIYFWPSNGSQVANPVPADPLNSSANCAVSSTDGNWSQIQYFPTYTPVSGDKLYFSVYNPSGAGPGQVQFSYTGDGNWVWGDNITYVSGSLTGWVEYSLDLTSHVGNEIDNIIIMPAGDNSSAVYVDNVYFGQTSILPTQNTIVYNETTNSGIYFWPLSGSQVANPVSDAVNSSANCAVNSTAEAWSQIQLFPWPNYSPVNGDKLFFSIYSPNGAVKGKVIFRHTGSGSWVGAVDVTYTAASQTGWVEYSVDLSAHVGIGIDQIIFQPSSDIIAATYVDNVYFKNAPGPVFVYNDTQSSGIYFWPLNGSQVPNPVSDAVNSSSNCAVSSTNGTWSQIQYYPYFKPVSGDKLYFSVYNPNNAGPGQVKFRYTSGWDWVDGANVTYTAASQTGWVEYSVDLSSNAGNIIDQIIMMPAGDNSAATYIDNLYFGKTSIIPVPQNPIVYNETTNSGIYFWPSSGSQVANPILDAVNSSANCAVNSTAEAWSQIQYFPTYTPISGDKLYFSIYNPSGAGPGQVQFSYTGNGNWVWGDNVTYVSGSLTGWVEYSLDLTSHVGNEIDNIIIMPAGNSSSAVYVDNVYFGSASILTETNTPIVANTTRCKVTVGVAPTATPFTGYSLVWYSSATSTTPLASTPLITSSTKTYWVAQRLGDGPISPKVAVITTVNLLPTEVLGAMTSNTVNALLTTGYDPATTKVGQYVGTTTEISYRIPAFTGVGLSYLWSVPTGVSIVGASNTNVLTVHYNNVDAGIGTIGAITVQAVNTNGCAGTAKKVTVSKVLPTAPSSIKMTNAALPLPLSGVAAAITTFAPYMGTSTELTLTAKPSTTATSYDWELPTGVTQLSGGNSNEITVNFAGVTSSNTYNYLTTATVPVSTNVLRIGVKARNGVGVSVTSNAGLLDPTTTSTARLLTLKATKPVAPSSLKMFNLPVSTSVAVTDISKFIGTTTQLTLTAAVSKLASSYSWEIPTNVTVVAGSDLTSNSIKVTFENVPAATASLYLGVKAVNGMGSSVTVNAATLLPATTSTARLLKVTAKAPATPGAVVGSLTICSTTASSVTYTITTAAAGANTYNVTAPAGCTINGGTLNTATIAATASASFTVNYPASFIATTTVIKTITIQSENGFGVSATSKVLKLTNVGATCPAPKFANGSTANDFKVSAYPNPSSSEFTIESSAKGAMSVKVYDMQGRLVEKADTNRVGSKLATGTYNVIVNQGANTKSLRVIKK